nr:hypothetical protein GCM10020093_087870 [Planobispora longispora]
MWSPYDEGPRSRRPIIIASAGLAVLIAGGVGLAMLARSDDGVQPVATDSASPSKDTAVPPPRPATSSASQPPAPPIRTR